MKKRLNKRNLNDATQSIESYCRCTCSCPACGCPTCNCHCVVNPTAENRPAPSRNAVNTNSDGLRHGRHQTSGLTASGINWRTT